jgi:hypothetical protein
MKQQQQMGRLEYRQWLQKKLAEHNISRDYLVSVVIVVERALYEELQRIGSYRRRPFYKLFKEDGSPTRAWIYAAELALWLKHHNFKANPYIAATIRLPTVRARILDIDKKEQIPLNLIFPSTRISTDRLKKYSDHFKEWNRKH